MESHGKNLKIILQSPDSPAEMTETPASTSTVNSVDAKTDGGNVEMTEKTFFVHVFMFHYYFATTALYAACML